MKKRTVLIIFVVVQLVGIACSWFSQHPYSAASSFLWGTSLLTLLPGNMLSTWIVQSLLWDSRFTLGTMSVIAILLAIAINAVVWFAAVATLRFMGRLVSGPTIRF